MRCVANGITDIGMIREENQDSFLIEEDLGIFAVADGMGGMLKGALASRFTLEGLLKLIKAGTVPIIDDSDCQKKIVLLLKGFIAKLSDLLREELGPEAGSTLAMALAKGECIYIAHLGDSRAYLLREGRLERLTRDHNMAALLVETGEITPEEAMHHPMRNVLTRHVGMEHAIPEVRIIDPEDGDRLLLCTDGLSSMVADGEIAHTLMEMKEPKMALKDLVDRANGAGGKDNITAVIVDCFHVRR